MTKDELTNMTRTELEERLGIMATEISALKVLALDLLKEPLQPILGLDWREIEKEIHKIKTAGDTAVDQNRRFGGLFNYIISTLKQQEAKPKPKYHYDPNGYIKDIDGRIVGTINDGAIKDTILDALNGEEGE